MKRIKKTYDTNFIYLCLHDDRFKKVASETIPSSTLGDWKSKGINHYYGRDYIPFVKETCELAAELQQKKTLLKAAKGIFKAYTIYRDIVNYSPDLKKIKTQFKTEITTSFDYVQKQLGKRMALKALGVNHHFLTYNTKLTCLSSALKKCLIKHPTQLASSEVGIISDAFQNSKEKDWQAVSIFHTLRRQKKLYCSKTTFYRYLHKLGLKLKKPKRIWKNYQPIIASKPFEIIHMDVSPIILNNTKGYLYMVIDNYSRDVLSYRLEKKVNSAFSLENLLSACKKYKLHMGETSLITDGGSENKGYINRFTNLPCVNIIHKVAQTDISSSNSMVESVFRQLKQYHLHLNPYDDWESMNRKLVKSVKDYRNKPLDVHKGLTAREQRKLKANNIQPDFTEYTSEEIHLVKENRKTQNKLNKCQKCN